MTRTEVKTLRPYEVITGEDILPLCGKDIARAMPCGKYLLVTDSGVPAVYVNEVSASLSDCGVAVEKLVLPCGEVNKNLINLEKIINKLSECNFTRKDGVVALGGGVIGDMAGLAAALYMRGIAYAQVPTTLLAAIDSSVGGKTAVDGAFGKNLIGAFWQPSITVCDVKTFSSLRREEILCGMGEGVKYALLSGGEIKDMVSSARYDNEKKCLISHKNGTFQPFDIERFVALCVKFKADVVGKDEREGNLRKILNLGHSVGHAIEKLSCYSIPHGVCVAKGTIKLFEAFPSVFPQEKFNLLTDIYANLGIDTSCPFGAEELIGAMRADKKSDGEEITLVLASDFGKPFLKTIGFSELLSRLKGVKHIKKSNLFGEIRAVPSKSYLHRMMICATLSDTDTEITGFSGCEDVKATLSCLVSLGASAVCEGDKIKISPVNHAKTANLDCGESGSTLRFLLPVAAGLGGEFAFSGKGKLAERPLEPLVSALREHGVKISLPEGKNLPLAMKGKISGGKFVITGEESSQYISGLLLAAPLTGEDVYIDVKGELKSKNYIDITIDVMGRFGVKAQKKERGYFVPGGQKYRSPKKITVEGDWSNALFFISGGLLCGRVSVRGLAPESIQGDRAAIEAMRALGGDIKFEKDTFIAQKSPLFAANFSVENMIDAAPILCVLCAFSEGESIISGVDRLRIKESDRLSAIINTVNSLGGSAVYEEGNGGTLKITGGKTRCGLMCGANDHRIVMSSAIAGAAVGATVTDCFAAAKSYPEFFGHFSMLGGETVER